MVWNLNPRNIKNSESRILTNKKFESRIPGPTLQGPDIQWPPPHQIGMEICDPPPPSPVSGLEFDGQQEVASTSQGSKNNSLIW